MSKEKLQIGDLVTSSVRDPKVQGLGLVVKTVEGPVYNAAQPSGVARVYWFKFGQVQLTWLHYLTKLEIQNE